MPKTHRTMRGAQVSMDQLRIQHEKTIAVGNMNVNAAGDTLGPGGVVTKTSGQRIKETKDLHTMTPGKIPVATGRDQVEKRKAQVQEQSAKAQADAEDRAAAEKILEEADAPVVKEVEEAPRASLAASMAEPKEVEHKQTDPKPQKKKKGVKRI